MYIAESREEGEYFEEKDKYIRWGEDFKDSLERKIRPPVENLCGTYYIGDEDKLRELASEDGSWVKDAHIVASPYPEIKAKIETLLKQ